MELVTDINRIRELAGQKDDENWRFRSFLKQSELSIREMDAMVYRHLDEVSSQIDCCTCGNCCEVILPVLSSSDIKRLSRELKVPAGEIIDRYLIPSEDSDGQTFKSKPCPFLAEKRCTVYPSRPEACRSYPNLHKKEFVFRLIQVVHNCSICPIAYNVFERLKADLWRGRRRSRRRGLLE